MSMLIGVGLGGGNNDGSLVCYVPLVVHGACVKKTIVVADGEAVDIAAEGATKDESGPYQQRETDC